MSCFILFCFFIFFYQTAVCGIVCMSDERCRHLMTVTADEEAYCQFNIFHVGCCHIRKSTILINLLNNLKSKIRTILVLVLVDDYNLRQKFFFNQKSPSKMKKISERERERERERKLLVYLCVCVSLSIGKCCSILVFLYIFMYAKLLPSFFSEPHWSNWGAWGPCTATCGYYGRHTRHRTCVGEGPCSGLSSESHCCNAHACPGKLSEN